MWQRSGVVAPMNEQDASTVLVTLGGQCVEAAFQGQQRKADRDVYAYYFDLKDVGGSQAERYVSVAITWEASKLIKDFSARAVEYSLNVIRWAFDEGTLSFDSLPPRSGIVEELTIKMADVQKARPKKTGAELRTFLLHEAYWIGYRLTSDPGRYWVEFASQS